MPITAEDLVASSDWAIAVDWSVKLAGAYVKFHLVNLRTCRAHRLTFKGIGLAIGFDKQSTEPSYITFRTEYPVTFSTFDGAQAMMATFTMLAWTGEMIAMWRGNDIRSGLFAKITSKSWGPTNVSIEPGTKGEMKLTYGDGRLVGIVACATDLPHKIKDKEVIVETPREPKRLTLEDTLFDFDSSKLKASAEPALMKTLLILSAKKRKKVVVEGHTDSVGKAAYNKELSRARAQAVKDWFIRMHHPGAKDFEVVAHGETKPIAPNKFTNGADNPEGRRSNRRVVVVFD